SSRLRTQATGPCGPFQHDESCSCRNQARSPRETMSAMQPHAEIVIFVKDQARQTHLSNLLNAAGRESVRASCLIQALRLIKELAPKLVITEIAQEGLEVLSTINRYYPTIKVMMLAGKGDWKTNDY